MDEKNGSKNHIHPQLCQFYFSVFSGFCKNAEKSKKREKRKIFKNDVFRKKDFKKGEMIFQIDVLRNRKFGKSQNGENGTFCKKRLFRTF